MGSKKRYFKNRQCRSSQSSMISPKSPLNKFKKSLQDRINNSLCSIEKRAMCDALQKSNERITRNLFGRNSSPRDNVIVINDSDSETNDGNKTDSSLSIIEYIPGTGTTTPLSSMINLNKRTLRSSRKQKIRSPLSLVDENASSRAPDDDVVELWSYLGSSSKTDRNVSKRHKRKWKVDNVFKVDRNIDSKYAKCLNLNTRLVRMKRGGSCDSSTMLLRNKSTMLEPSNFVRKAKRRSINTNLNIRHINAKSNRHQIRIEEDKRSKLETLPNSKHKLREIIVDGCNVAMLHTNGKMFSEKGIALVIHYFESRGHTVKVFLPQHVRERNCQLLEKWYSKGTVVFTPSRYIAGRRITSYEDRYILEYATKCNGIVISSDQYRDLYKEKPEWRDTILNRLLMPTFVGDYVMFPEDPLGKSGPDLQTFLRH